MILLPRKSEAINFKSFLRFSFCLRKSSDKIKFASVCKVFFIVNFFFTLSFYFMILNICLLKVLNSHIQIIDCVLISFQYIHVAWQPVVIGERKSMILNNLFT